MQARRIELAKVAPVASRLNVAGSRASDEVDLFDVEE